MCELHRHSKLVYNDLSNEIQPAMYEWDVLGNWMDILFPLMSLYSAPFLENEPFYHKDRLFYLVLLFIVSQHD